MAEVDTSIYKNQPNPLGTAQGVFNLMNTAQQNQLLQTANQQRQFDLRKAQYDALIGSLGPLAGREDVTKPMAVGHAANVIRSLGINPDIAGPMIAPIQNAPDDKTARSQLGNLYSILAGSSAGQPVTGPVTESGAPQTQPLATRVTGGTQKTGLTPEEQAAATAAGTIGGGTLGQARNLASNLETSTYGIRSAIHMVRALGPQATGPLTKEITGIKSFLVSSGAAKTLGIEPKLIDEVSEWQSANKYLNDWARSSGDVHSVEHLNAAQESNPNMSLAGNTIIKTGRTSLALQRMRSVQAMEFDATGLPASQFTQWASKNWNVKHDPVAYMADEMSPAELKKYEDKLPSGKRALFWSEIGRLEKQGIIKQIGAQ